MTEAEKDQFRTVPLSALRHSTTNPRKTFNEARMADLTASIEKRGVMQPLLVRLHAAEKGTFEIIAGERRFRAATRAKVETVPVRVMDLDDKGVLEVQVIENLQREDIHQLEEADGYQQLIRQHGYTIVDIAAKIGKSEEYVSKRLKLRDLVDPRARKAFLEDELGAGVAFALARIPDAKLQGNAFQSVANRTPGEAVRIIREQYMLTLAKAPFDMEAVELVPGVGACGPCPSRTGNQASLFGDVSGKDICTNPTCFSAKVKASAALRVAAAKESGLRVIEGAAAKKLLPYGDYNPRGHVLLDDTCYRDSKNRTYRQILGKSAPEPTLVVSPHTEGKVLEVLPEAVFKQAAKEAGFSPRSDGDRSEASRAAARKAQAKQKLLRAVIKTAMATIVDVIESGRKPVTAALRAVLANQRRSRDILEKREVLPPRKKGQYGPFDGVVLKAVDRMPDAHLVALLVEADMADASQYLGGSYPRLMQNLATSYGVDLKKIEKEHADNVVKAAALKKAGKSVDALAIVHASHKPKGETTMAAALRTAKPAEVKKRRAAMKRLLARK